MKRILALFLLIASTLTIAETNNTSASADLSPAGRSIAEARKAIEKKPTQYSGYNLLAMALARRARETSDVGFYAQAEDALKRSLDLAPGNLDGEKIHVWLLLGRHEFAAALDAAKALNKRVPDDVLIYGFLTDANAELGNYKEAERAAQWMSSSPRTGCLSGRRRSAAGSWSWSCGRRRRRPRINGHGIPVHATD